LFEGISIKMLFVRGLLLYISFSICERFHKYACLINTSFAGNGDYSPSVSKRQTRETVVTILVVVSGKLRLQSQNISHRTLKKFHTILLKEDSQYFQEARING
jgi:hypothetical protein